MCAIREGRSSTRARTLKQGASPGYCRLIGPIRYTVSAQCRRKSVVGGCSATRESRPTVPNEFDVPMSTIVGSERIATKIGVGKSKVGSLTVRSVLCLPHVQSWSSSWPGPHGDGLGSLPSVEAVLWSA